MRRPKRFFHSRNNPTATAALVLAALCLILLICCFPGWILFLAIAAVAIIILINRC